MTSSSKGRILVCDDERGIREILARLLRREGYEVLEAADGVAALVVISERAPDAVFLDIRMPGPDGFEVLRRVKQFRPRLPVIIVTTHAAETDADAALASGAQAYLIKPFGHEEILRSLHRVLEERHLGGTGSPGTVAR